MPWALHTFPDPCPHVGGCDCVPDTVAGLWSPWCPKGGARLLQKLHTAQSHDCSASALSFRKCAALMSGTGPCVVCFVRFLSAFWDHGSVVHPCPPPLRFTESQCGSSSLVSTSGLRVSQRARQAKFEEMTTRNGTTHLDATLNSAVR